MHGVLGFPNEVTRQVERPLEVHGIRRRQPVIEAGVVGVRREALDDRDLIAHRRAFVIEIAGLDVKKEGSAIRYSELYKQQGGSNVNFVEVLSESALRIRTYERGVEDETLSCGTGATAAAIAAFSSGAITTETVELQTEGGKLQVKFRPKDNGFSDIWLLGPALQVFKGEIVC